MLDSRSKTEFLPRILLFDIHLHFDLIFFGLSPFLVSDIHALIERNFDLFLLAKVVLDLNVLISSWRVAKV